MKEALVFFFMLLWLNGNATEAAVFKNGDTQLIGNYITFYEDVTGTMSASEIISNNIQFSKWNRDVFIHTATPSVFWFSFSIKNQCNEDLWLDIANGNLSEIELFFIDHKGSFFDSIQGGCLNPINEFVQNGYTFQSLLIEKEDTTERTFLLHVKTNLVYEVPIFVGSIASIVNNRSHYDTAGKVVIGAFLALFFYNVFLFFVTKDKVYVYYSFYLLAAIGVGTYLNNYPIITAIMSDNLAFNYLNTWLWTLFFATALFTIRYFDLKKVDPFFYKVILAVVLVFVLIGVANLFVEPYYLSVFNRITGLVFYLVCLFFSYRLWCRGVKGANLYCIGWTFMMVSAMLYISVTNGWIPYNAFTRNISYFGSVIEIIFFSVALGRRISDLQSNQVVLNEILTQKNTELTALNESLDSFNYHVSHDLKTVLNNTLSLSRMAKKYNDKQDTNRVNEIVQKLENVAINGNETVLSFLTIGRLDTLLKEENQRKINLADELETLLLQYDLKAKIQVEIQTNQLIEFYMHPKAFESVFLNFLTNSIKYNDSRPKAWISFLETDTTYQFIYRDNGKGIDIEKHGKDLFKPFQRAGADNRYEGTGIGLYLVKRIVTSLGGEITLESELGKGTTFSVNFKKGGIT